jgi:hypothetical protein
VYAPPSNYFFSWALAAGWNHLKAKRGDASATGSPDWASIVALTAEIEDSGYAATLDHLWISKADPDYPDTYNDTGKVWDFLPLQGSGSEWHVLPGKRAGMPPAHDYVLAQLFSATTPANWLLGWHTQADITAGVAIAGAWLRSAGQVALAFCIQDPSVATRTLYAVEADTDADEVRLVAHVAGERTVIKAVSFACAPGEEIWLGADFRNATRINVYAAKVQGNLIQAANLVISEVDSSILRGGAIGLMALECVAYFFAVRGGSPRHVDKSEWAALSERALIADLATEADHAAEADEADHAADADHADDADALSGAALSTTVADNDTTVPTGQAVIEYVAARWVWLTTPATSTGWDGDARAAGSGGVIDLSAVFGLPAGIKAIAAWVAAVDETPGVYFRLGPASNAAAINGRTQVANQYSDVCGVSPCDENGDVYWALSGELDGVVIQIWGYAV